MQETGSRLPFVGIALVCEEEFCLTNTLREPLRARGRRSVHKIEFFHIRQSRVEICGCLFVPTKRGELGILIQINQMAHRNHTLQTFLFIFCS